MQVAFFFRKGWKVIRYSKVQFSWKSSLSLFIVQKNSFSRSCQIVAISCKRSLCVGVLSVRWLHWSASQVTRTSENMIVTLQQVGCTWYRQLASEMISPATCGGMMCTTWQLTSWKGLPQRARRISEKKKQKGVKFWKSNQDSHLKLWTKPSQKTLVHYIPKDSDSAEVFTSFRNTLRPEVLGRLQAKRQKMAAKNGWLATSTPGKINMEPDNTPLEKEKHLPNYHFQVLC